jgi:hypothetical protein
MQSKIDSYRNIVFEWIPYDQFGGIEKVGQGGFATIYSATWDGPLKYDINAMKYKRYPSRVALKCLFDSQDITDEFLNEVWIYSMKFNDIYNIKLSLHILIGQIIFNN